ncbi:MAG: bifunctional phosphopantothenoylcysteine decarboxylase/phosphopantothenate--cysteine ligase CoaBC [Tissierellia bacterium]|nr:bifunctional phosphopantothenoylcysteine decarboxylase/phosphopantothenate--cysteine ligase CoaBC [Tissierellia bacterium]
MKLKDKKILLGVTGGISIYKSPGICSILRKQGAKVKVVMTKSATEFVKPITFQTMTDNYVHTEMFSDYPISAEVEHIELAKWADIIVIAPATANTIAKFANGIGDNLLTNIFLAHRCPVIIVPAMNTFMLNSPANRENMQKLRDRGITILGTHTDLLACLDVGDGKMLEPEEIVEEIDFALREKDLAGKKFTITAGPTQEAIDPVRYLTNHSSGKMGYALAEEASKRGAVVTLISGPTNLKPPKVEKFIPINSTLEMFDAVKKEFKNTDVLIKSAAPADFRPENYINEKIKKESSKDKMSIPLVQNPDIAKTMGELKDKQIIVGFAAESQNEIENGIKKLKAKNFDMIVINNIKRKDAGFKSDTNAVTIIDKNENSEELDLMSKLDLAGKILDRVEKLF